MSVVHLWVEGWMSSHLLPNDIQRMHEEDMMDATIRNKKTLILLFEDENNILYTPCLQHHKYFLLSCDWFS